MMKKLKGKIESNKIPQFEKKVKFYEFYPEMDKPFKAKTFHSKGFFIKTENPEFNSYLGTIGSSNFADRSYHRDNELNFWVYSKNPKFGSMIEKERKSIVEECREYDSVKKRESGGILGVLFNWVMKLSKMG